MSAVAGRGRGRRVGALSLSRSATGPFGRRLWLAAAAGALATLCGIGLLATSGWLITRASERPPVLALSIAIGSVQAFALGRGLARYLQRLGTHSLSLEVLGKLRLRLYDTLEPLVPGGLSGTGSGAVLSGFVSDAELVAEGLAKETTAAVDVAASVLIGVAVASVIEPAVGGVLLAGSLAVVGVSFAAGRLGRDAAGREAAARAETAGSVIETMRAARELVAFGREDLVAERLDEVRRRSAGAARRRALSVGVGRAAATVTSAGALVAVVVAALGAHGAHRLSGVMVAVVAFTALAVLDRCSNLSAVLADADASGAAARRLARLEALDVPAREPVADRSAQVAHGAAGGGVAGRRAGEGGVAADLDAVEVTAGDAAILRGVSLAVAPGRRVALVGRSGSGKTTVVHTLLHFVEAARGRATIGGVDVRDMTRRGIALHVGSMAEQTHVFAASLADNLRLAHRDATDEQCVDVLGRVGLGAWYASLPDGLATALGSGGRPMSAGERQRLGMARALLSGGEVLLLDEPTAHLDPASSARVLSELLGSAGDRSVVVVSHEPGIAGWADEVVTLEGGKVVARSSR